MKPDDGSGLSPYSQQDGVLSNDPMDVSPRGGPGLFPTQTSGNLQVLSRSPVLTAASVAHDVAAAWSAFNKQDAAALVERYARQEVLKALARAYEDDVVERLRQAEAKLAAIAELARAPR